MFRFGPELGLKWKTWAKLKKNRVQNFVYDLIYVSKAYIPNMRPLRPPLHVEKFVWWVVGGGGCVK